MDQNTSNPQPNIQDRPTTPKPPNEQSRLNIDEFLRITDPNTQQVFLEQRA